MIDPDANADEQTTIAARILGGEHVDSGDAVRLAELVVSMDGWLSCRGALPERWASRTERRRALSLHSLRDVEKILTQIAEEPPGGDCTVWGQRALVLVRAMMGEIR